MSVIYATCRGCKSNVAAALMEKSGKRDIANIATMAGKRYSVKIKQKGSVTMSPCKCESAEAPDGK